jgi:eukaryotic translation initiation factor 2C
MYVPIVFAFRPFPHLSRRVDKKFYRPTTFQSFAIVVFERRQRFSENDAKEMGRNLLDACRQVGIIVQDTNPSVFFANGQNGVVRVSTSPSPSLSSPLIVKQELLNIGGQFSQMKKPTPPLLVVVLPDGASDIYTAVK